jgi:hypothetical protein
MKKDEYLSLILTNLRTQGDLDIQDNRNIKLGFEVKKQKNLLVQVIAVNNRFGVKTMGFKMFNDDKVEEFRKELEFARHVVNILNGIISVDENHLFDVFGKRPEEITISNVHTNIS